MTNRTNTDNTLIRLSLSAAALRVLFDENPDLVLEIRKGIFKDVITRNFGEMWTTEIAKQVRAELYDERADSMFRSNVTLKPEHKTRIDAVAKAIAEESLKQIERSVREVVLDTEKIDELIEARVVRYAENEYRTQLRRRVTEVATDTVRDLLKDDEKLYPLVVRALRDIFNAPK